MSKERSLSSPSGIKGILASDRGVLALNAALSLLFSLLLIKVSVDFLGLEQRGGYVFLLTVVSLFCSVIRCGVNQGSLAFFRGCADEEQISVLTETYVAVVLIQSILICLLSVAFYDSLIPFFPESTVVNESVFCVFVVVTFVSNAIMFFASMVGKAVAALAFTIASNLISLSTIGLMWEYDWRTLDSFTLAVCAGLLAATVVASKMMKLPLKIGIDIDLIRQQVTSGIRMLGWQLGKDFMYRLDTLVLPYLLSAPAYGGFTVIQSIGQSVWRLIDPVLSIYQRELVSSKNKKIISLDRAAYSVLALAVIAYLVVAVAVAIALTDNKYVDIWYSIATLFLAYVLFSNWKIFAVQQVVDGKNLFMYVTVVIFYAVYLVLIQGVSSLNAALLVTAVSYAVLSVAPFVNRFWSNPLQS